jgi:hypothetical protein
VKVNNTLIFQRNITTFTLRAQEYAKEETSMKQTASTVNHLQKTSVYAKKKEPVSQHLSSQWL